MLLSSQHEMLRDTVRAFAQKELAPNAARWGKESISPREALKGLGAMGLFAVAISEEWDGAGMDSTALALAIEEISAGDGATSTIVSVTKMAEKVCSDAIQVHGGYGYVADFPVERIWRDVRVCKIYEGASDIQRLVIGRALAG